MIFSLVASSAVLLVRLQPAENAQPQKKEINLSPAQLFILAEAASDAGDFPVAEQAYRALAEHPNPDLRNEARFCWALMLANREGKLREAAIELRRVLDAQPRAARVRLELARIEAMLGNPGAARRQLRAIEASSLPPDVRGTIRFYAAALEATRPYGGSIEVAIAPDTNVNRSTRADTLSTVIGNFELNQDARARSGVGAALRGAFWWRRPLPSGDWVAQD